MITGGNITKNMDSDRIRELRCGFGRGLHGDEHVDHDSGDEPGDMQSRDVTRRMQSVHIHVLKT